MKLNDIDDMIWIIGKVILEKVLRTFGNVKMIYISITTPKVRPGIILLLKYWQFVSEVVLIFKFNLGELRLGLQQVPEWN